MNHWYTWGSILVVVLASCCGDVLTSLAMKRVGDLGAIRRTRGLSGAIARVIGSGTLWMGIAFMAVAFFSLLLALSWADVSLVGPASASLTFLANAAAGHLFLRERVDHRRWLAAIFVAAGVVLLAA